MWGEPPRWDEDGASWVECVTRPRIDADPRVVEATAQQQAAAKAVRKALEPDDLPRLRMYCPHLRHGCGGEEPGRLPRRPSASER